MASPGARPIFERARSARAVQLRPVSRAIVNGSEAACHNRNKLRGTAVAIETIELYRFEAGRLAVRYFIRPPGA